MGIRPRRFLAKVKLVQIAKEFLHLVHFIKARNVYGLSVNVAKAVRTFHMKMPSFQRSE